MPGELDRASLGCNCRRATWNQGLLTADGRGQPPGQGFRRYPARGDRSTVGSRRVASVDRGRRVRWSRENRFRPGGFAPV